MSKILEKIQTVFWHQKEPGSKGAKKYDEFGVFWDTLGSFGMLRETSFLFNYPTSWTFSYSKPRFLKKKDKNRKQLRAFALLTRAWKNVSFLPSYIL